MLLSENLIGLLRRSFQRQTWSQCLATVLTTWLLKLFNGKQLPCGLIYYLSEKELDTLRSYLEVQLKWD